MTPQERAERVLSAVQFTDLDASTKLTATIVIAAEIEKAVQGHRCDQVPTCRTVNDNCIYWAQAEAYEEAARIVAKEGARLKTLAKSDSPLSTGYWGDAMLCRQLTRAIRARATEVANGK